MPVQFARQAPLTEFRERIPRSQTSSPYGGPCACFGGVLCCAHAHSYQLRYFVSRICSSVCHLGFVIPLRDPYVPWPAGCFLQKKRSQKVTVKYLSWPLFRYRRLLQVQICSFVLKKSFQDLFLFPLSIHLCSSSFRRTSAGHSPLPFCELPHLHVVSKAPTFLNPEVSVLSPQDRRLRLTRRVSSCPRRAFLTWLPEPHALPIVLSHVTPLPLPPLLHNFLMPKGLGSQSAILFSICTLSFSHLIQFYRIKWIYFQRSPNLYLLQTLDSNCILDILRHLNVWQAGMTSHVPNQTHDLPPLPNNLLYPQPVPSQMLAIFQELRPRISKVSLISNMSGNPVDSAL